MIGLDTNVLLRVFINDDAPQHARASALLLANKAVGGEPPRLHVGTTVVCEVVWALDSIYRQPKSEILKVLDTVLESRDIDVADRGEVQAAVRRYRGGKGDFADYFIHESANRAGCEYVATFDETLLKDSGFRPV